MDSRQRNVEMALPHTCQWLRSHSTFLAWSDHNRTEEPRGPLWIKGKPGSGKSTLVKETLDWARRTWSDQLILSYFFNARATGVLEKSCLGLYRSLVHQILFARPDLSSFFLDEFKSKIQEVSVSVETWTSVELQNFLLKVWRTGHLPSLTVFVDALDEGDYDNVWRMVTFFEIFPSTSASNDSVFRVCLSSRHYPQIDVETDLSIILEDQIGHEQDIRAYIDKTLPDKKSAIMHDIREILFRKAGGVFLWVVLTIGLLRPLYSRGRVNELKQQLEVLPRNLHDLFWTILISGMDNIDECVTLLQWILVAKWPLSATELCLWIHSRHETDLDPFEVRIFSDQTIALKRIIDVSRGLVEPIKGSNTRLQLIHETVRQFLTSICPEPKQIQDCRPLDLDFSIKASHGAVALDCLNHLMRLPLHTQFNTLTHAEYPLALYAARYWWKHMREVYGEHDQRLVDLAEELLTNPQHLAKWVQIYDIDSNTWNARSPLRTYDLYQPLYYVVRTGIPSLLTTKLLQAADFNKQEGPLGNVLQAASAQGSEEIVRILLTNGADVNATGGRFGTALQAACLKGHEEVVRILLQHGARIESPDEPCFSALRAASHFGHSGVVRILISSGADVNAQGKPSGTALYAASKRGHEETAQILLDNGADVHIEGGSLGTALNAATVGGYPGIVQKLLERGARIPHGSEDRVSKLQGVPKDPIESAIASD